MTRGARQIGGLGLILVWIAVWSVGAVTLSDRIGTLPLPAEFAFYLIAGIVWIAPLRPLIRWMQNPG